MRRFVLGALSVTSLYLSACSSWSGKEELAVRRPASLQAISGAGVESEAALTQMMSAPSVRESLQLKVDQIEEIFYRGQDALAQYDRLLDESVNAKLTPTAFMEQVNKAQVYPRLLALQALNEELTDRFTYYVLNLSDIASGTVASENRDKALDGLKYIAHILSQAPLSTRIALNAWAEEMHERAPRSSMMQPVYARLFVYDPEAMQSYRREGDVKGNMSALVGDFRSRRTVLSRRIDDLTQTYSTYAKAPTTRLPAGQWSFAFVGGPSPKVTPELLHAFHAQRMPASFFFVGDKMELYPDMVHLISIGGMHIENQSQTGREMSRLFSDEMKQELSAANGLIKDGTGQAPRFFISSTNDVVADAVQTAALRANNLRLIRSNIDAFNWLDRDPHSVAVRLHRQMQIWPSGVVVVHDGFLESVQTVNEILQGLAKTSSANNSSDRAPASSVTGLPDQTPIALGHVKK